MLTRSAVLIAVVASSMVVASRRVPPPSPVPVVTVKATEFAFIAPATIAAGTTTFRLTNAGKQLHHVAVIRLTQGKTPADYIAAMKRPGPPPAWAVEVGGPNAAVPGGHADATMTLEPGQYVLACFIPSPGEQAPHLMKGMVKGLVVTPASTAGAAPAADVEMRMNDYSFTLSRPLTAGRHTVRVSNLASQSHEFVLVRLAPGKSAADMAAWVESGMKGAPPGMPLGGTTQLARGRTVDVPMELAPGSYGLICFIPDAKDGKPHSAHGMTQTFMVAAR